MVSLSPTGLAVHGMLFVAADVDAADDADYNQWYDREHVEERVRVPGFLSGARYQSLQGGRKYLGLYRTAALDVFTSPAYRAAFGQQTPWSVTNLDRMRQPVRRVCAVEAVVGFGSGSRVVVLPLPLADDRAALVAQAHDAGRQLAALPGFVQSYLLVPDVALSTPLPKEQTEGRVLQPMLVVETSHDAGSDAALASAADLLQADAAAAWRYALGWKLAAADLA
ncbi:hypothetical protein AAFF27_08015 [Xylophilus sp. GW821-FHT01B05]